MIKLIDKKLMKVGTIFFTNNIYYVSSGNITAGNFTEKIELKGLRQCVMSCCLTETCNIVFIADSRCYQVECASDELCLPLPRSGRKWDSHVSMILVKPVLPNGKLLLFN